MLEYANQHLKLNGLFYVFGKRTMQERRLHVTLNPLIGSVRHRRSQ